MAASAPKVDPVALAAELSKLKEAIAKTESKAKEPAPKKTITTTIFKAPVMNAQPEPSPAPQQDYQAMAHNDWQQQQQYQQSTQHQQQHHQGPVPEEDKSKPGPTKKKRHIRSAAGSTWEDPTLMEWDDSDYRIFVGDLGNEVTDESLRAAFSKYPSFLKAKVIREKFTQKSKGFGFVSLGDPDEFVKALREMDGKYVGNRPIKLRKSNWKDREFNSKKSKQRRNKYGF